MQRWRGLQSVPTGWGHCVVTIGVFDGIHRGHQAIISETVALSRAQGVPSVLITFVPHPSEVVRPGSHPPVLTTIVRRAELVESLGIDVFCALPFTLELSTMPPDEFVHSVLVDRLHTSAVIVGENFRYGHKAAGDVAALRRQGRTFGFSAQAATLLAAGDTPLSATYVRSCVQAGDLSTAAEVLGRPHRIDGVVERGDQRGRELGYPTANLRAGDWAAVPADGVYAGRVVALDEWGRTVDAPALGTAAISVGTNPTFDTRTRRIEAFILDFDADLYGANIGIEFVSRLRGMVRFDSVDELVTQMAADVEQTRAVIDAG